MDLSNLKPAKGATKTNRRLGRGQGSGTGGHSSTRGTKGQTSRSGNRKMPFWFEGGQMPLQRRVPKFGFNNKNFRTSYRPVNLGRIQQLIEDERLSVDEAITPERLVEAGAAHTSDLIKVLGGGDLEASVEISAHAFSASARKKIEAAGGTATAI